MRVLSPHMRYSVQVIEGQEVREVDRTTGAPYTRTVQAPCVAEFEAGGLFPHEVELALSTFSFKGLTEGANPALYVSIFDTEHAQKQKNWTDEYRAHVEERLRHLAAQAPSRMVIADDLKVPRPWPTYDELGAEDILETVGIAGYDPVEIIRYERENANRPFLIEKLVEMHDAKAGEPIAVVSG